MAVRPAGGEPATRDWRARRPEEVITELADGPGSVVVAIDGRSGAGKSTLADRFARAIPRACVVHTDDIAWHAPMFVWADLLADGVLRPFRRGEAVSFRPPAWSEHGRTGSIDVPTGTRVLILEGVGSSQRDLSHLIDRSVWVQSDHEGARTLGLARDIASGENGDEQASREFWDWWESHEAAFLQDDRPWERADLVIAGVGGPASDDAVHLASNAALRTRNRTRRQRGPEGVSGEGTPEGKMT